MLKLNEQVVFYGRGGQGAASAAPLLVLALDYEGGHAQALPSFGGERRGTPVKVSLRISNQPITIREEIQEPTCIVILDTKLMTIVDVTSNMKPGGIAIISTQTPPSEIDLGIKLSIVGTVNAAEIAQEVFGFKPIPLTNMPMLGAFAATTGWVTLDSIIKVIEYKMEGDIAKNSIKAAKMGYESTKVENRG